MTHFDFFMALLWAVVCSCVVWPWYLRRKEKRVKLAFQVDTDFAERARKEISRLQALVQEQGRLARQGRDSTRELFERYIRLAHWIQDDRDTAEAKVLELTDTLHACDVARRAAVARLTGDVERLQEENKKLRKVWSETGTIARHRAAQVVKLKLETDQLQTQLAGCSTAARGGTSPRQVANPGDFGWSPAYQDVLELRRDYDRLREEPPFTGLGGK